VASSAAKKPASLRGVPSDIVREAKAAAAKRGVTLAGFVAETLARAVRSSAGAGTPSELSADIRWYERNRERLVRDYRGEYVAILERRVVDHDPSFEALAERVFKREGSRNVFMPRVDASRGPLRVHSPRRLPPR
jgi:hypothetical protein